MIKVIGLLKRKAGVSQEEFFRHWKDHHGALAMRIPGFGTRVRKYVQVHRVNIPDLGARERYNQATLPMEYDGAVEMWFDNLEELQKAFAALADPVACKELREDEDRFIDGKNTLSIIVGEEFTIYEQK